MHTEKTTHVDATREYAVHWRCRGHLAYHCANYFSIPPPPAPAPPDVLLAQSSSSPATVLVSLLAVPSSTDLSDR